MKNSKIQLIKLGCYLSLYLSVIGCSNNLGLEKSVFISDPQDPGLPIYSEMGYNTFGAHYDRSNVISNNFQTPIKVINRAGVTSFIFTGQRDMYFSEFVIQFTISGTNPQSYSDLISLDNSFIDLTSSNCVVTIRDEGVDYPVQILDGSLNFKKARSVKVDNQMAETTLSGTFEFHAIINQFPVTMSSGRFDVGVDAANFYKY